MAGRVLQLNVSRGGVPKRPIPEGFVTPLGIEGDEVAHPQFHGGPQKALLLLASEVVDKLAAEGFPVYYGALGENVTTRGVDHRQFRAGQRYRIGDVIIELTRPRIPCSTLNVYGPGIQEAIYDRAVKEGDITSPHWGMSGFYAAVLQPGTIRKGDPIQLLEQVA
ncbi:MAG: MOSC domain-containing protein [Bryobacteraceae bacterium]|nr:MOSC domain-containing protein [Bryobacteraceae bacterium]